MGEVQKNKNKENKSNVFTRETLGVVCMLFSTLCLVCLITRDKVFSVPGQYINAFLLGVFGYFAFGVALFGVLGGLLLVTDKRLPLTKKQKTFITLAFVCLTTFLHMLSTGNATQAFGEYLSASYNMGAGGVATASAGGFIIALIAYPVLALMTLVGGCVLVGVLFALCCYFFIAETVKSKKGKPQTQPALRSSFVENEDATEVEVSGEREYPVSGVSFEEKPSTQRLFVSNPEDFQVKSKKEMAKSDKIAGIKLDFSEKGLGVGNSEGTYSEAYAEDMKKKLEYIKTPAQISLDGDTATYYNAVRISEPIQPLKYTPPEEKPVEKVEGASTPTAIPLFEHDGSKILADDAEDNARKFSDKYASDDCFGGQDIKPEEPTEVFRPVVSERLERIVKEEAPAVEQPAERTEEREAPQIPEIKEEQPTVSPILSDRRASRILFGDVPETPKQNPVEEPAPERAVGDEGLGLAPRRSRAFSFEQKEEEQPPVEEKPVKKAPPINRVYNRPPLDLLETYSATIDASEENHDDKMAIIQRTLEDFNINVIPQGYIQGPTITRYEIMMPAGVTVRKVLPYDNDLKMRLASRDGIRIEAPIPGKDLVGIEVANKHKITVGLKEVLEGAAGKKSKADALMFAIGKNLVGESIVDNLAKGPHFLVAGATGSGKSVCLNVMIVSMLMRYSPEELRLVLIDPKRVGFRIYEHLPHLMIDEIITEPQKAVAVLQWAYNEMERRYKLFEDCGGVISDIGAYNAEIANDVIPKLPRIVIVVDELADLMETCKKDMEARIRALAAKARAAGVHLVLATQRPSVDVITGTIKANLPSRIALKVMNFADSSTILSEGGAEKLLGNGDMLYKNSIMSECERYQGAWVSDREISNVVKYIIENNEAYFDDDLQDYLEKSMRPKQDEAVSSSGVGDDDGDDGVSELLIKAVWLAVTSGTISISQLQRRFQIGYARAGGLVDKMERMGLVSGNEGSKARRVLITKEECEAKFGASPDLF